LTTPRSPTATSVAYVYPADEEASDDLYAGDVIKDIVTRFFIFGGVTRRGSILPLVETGPRSRKTFVFNYVPASQAFDDIAELAGYIWYIDYEKRLHFTPKDRNASAVWAHGDLAELAEPEGQREPGPLPEPARSSEPGRALTDERTDTVIATEADQKLF